MSFRKVVVLGGTFDPVHTAHVTLLRGAITALDATLGVMAVEDGHRHRNPAVVALDDRRRLVQLAIGDDELLIEASQLGIDVGLVGVVERLVARGEEVHVVFGADSARHLDRWRGRQALAAATLWSVPRHGDPADELDGVVSLPLVVPGLSATQIRFAAAAGRTVGAAVPPPCRAAVERLYGPARAGRRVAGMRIGVMFANGARSADPEHAAALAVAAEDIGYESLWAVQHVVMPVEHESQYPYSDSGTVPGGTAIAIPDPLVWLAWAGALTSRIRLATGVLVLPQQHPLVVAKQVATLDRLTGGRVILGVGAGWLREEFDALGAGFDDRGARIEESIDVLRSAWSSGATEFAGTTMAFSRVHVEPKPASPVPIVVGGHSDAAARRAGRVADGFFPLSCQGDRLVHLVDTVRAEAREAGRDEAAVEITVDAPRTPAEARVHARLGVDRVVVNAPNVPVEALRKMLEAKFAGVEEVVGRA